MLAGGPSAQYAAELVASPTALIAITGYQDEEAPGRQLQAVASGAIKQLMIGGQRLPVRCRVETYGLSAHADGQELGGLVAALDPRAVVLVHGDLEARQGLSRLLFEGGCRQIHLPASGDTVDFAARSPRRARQVSGVGAGRALDDARQLAELHRALWSSERRGRSYSASDLAEQWYGSDAVPVDLSPLEVLLRGKQPYFLADAKRPFLFRCVDPEAQARQAAGRPAEPVTGAEPRDAKGRLEQNAALALVDRLLAESDLHRRGAERESWTLRLYFRFPDVSRERQAETLAALAEQSGWQVAVHPQPHLASIEQLAAELVAPLAPLARSVSIRTDERAVVASVGEMPPAEALAEVQQRFARETGYSLTLRLRQAGTPAAKTTYDESGRMEINLALAAVDKAFAEAPHAPYKKSKKRYERGELLELSFISPEVGARYQAQIDELEAVVLWPIRISDKVDQQAVLAAVRGLLPAEWKLRKNPGLDVAARQVRLRFVVEPRPEQRATISAQLVELTGFTLAS